MEDRPKLPHRAETREPDFNGTPGTRPSGDGRWQGFLLELPQIGMTLDRNGRISFVNRHFLDLTGWEEGDVLDQDWFRMFVPEPIREKIRQEFLATLDQESFKNISSQEHGILTRDGEVRDVAWSCVPEKSPGGEVLEVTCLGVDLTQHRRAQEALEESRRRLSTLMSNLPGMAYRCKNDPDWTMEFVSDGCLSLTGFPAPALVNNRDLSYSDLIHPDDRDMVWGEVQAGLRVGRPFELIYRIFDGDQREKWVWERGRGIFDSQGVLLALEGFISDISDLKRAEAERERLRTQLAQAQRMESIGRLAGGVAHDFNNMLGVILGFTELAVAKVPGHGEIRADLDQIRQAAERSAEITRQLLAFARKQVIVPRALDLNGTVEGMLKMLRRLIGEEIDLAWLPETELWPVRVDPSQIDQILANLCVNARDAIPGHGQVIIETGRVNIDEAYCTFHEGCMPGDYVLLSVSDDGKGMEGETMENLFEPFFTTKGEHQGTGLGLATVYGIVKQNNGFINVYSEPGVGTTFKIYLPRHRGETSQVPRPEEGPIPSGRGETVLVLEDEEAILHLTSRILRELGYRVLSATKPGQALNLVEERGEGIDLLLTDVVLPDRSGREVAEQVRSLFPEIRVVFMSGYTADVIAHHGILNEGIDFLQKPFSTANLARKVRQALDSG